MRRCLNPNLVTAWIGMALVLIFSGLPRTGDAAFIDDVGYVLLQAELGATIPDATGVAVTQVESAANHSLYCPSPEPPCAYAPNPGVRSIKDGYNGPDVEEPFSGHANSVGRRFYGDTSTTPGIGIAPSPSISAYEAGNWLQSGFLRLGVAAWPGVTPGQVANPGRVANHSYVASFGVAAYDLEALHRIDWLIEQDESIQVAGFAGGTRPLLGSALNAIVVNPTGDPKDRGSEPVAGDAVYAVAHPRPDLVAPETNASNVTPRVASAAALLIHTAQLDPSLSNGFTTNRHGDTIYNAERSEVVKAALMTGADRVTNNSSPEPPLLGNITDYRVDIADRTDNGLDRRYGAGQLNIYNSYHIIAAGEQDSDEDDGGGGNGQISAYGFDHDPAFGGQGGRNKEASYFFSVGADVAEFTASLVWNIEIDPGASSRFDQAAILYDLDLSLYEAIDPGDPGTWVLRSESISTSENTENIWVSLAPGKDYVLQVTTGVSQAPFDWDYGLAWQIKTVFDVGNYVGQTQTAAEAAIVADGLSVGVIAAASSSTVLSGTVISQNPTPCTACVAPGDSVDLVVSTGPLPVLIDVGNYVGQTQTAAEAVIVADGLSVGTISLAADSSAAGTVIGQSPAGCITCARAGDPVDLTVSTGPAAIAVSNYIGLSQSAAETAIVGDGLTVGVVTPASSATVPSGTVISQNPNPCTACVVPGTAVDLLVSSGPESIDVGTYTDLTQAAAEAAIVTDGLSVGIVTTASSDTVPAGDVISQNPTSCASCAAPGDSVDLVVSSGLILVLIDVPDVVGMSQADAEANIVVANLTVGSVTTATNDSVPAGTVLSQSPVVCAACVTSGSAVNLVVSVVGQVQEPSFTDVPMDYWAFAFIEDLAISGITAGCGNENYCPLSPVTRAQMAVFLERGIHGSDYNPPAATGNVFSDVAATDFAASFIEQFFQDGITSGCGNNNYCPNAEVTRDQMAVFLLRAKYGSGYSPPAATGVFDDVPLSHWAVHWIEQLAAEGITSGFGNGNYCPDVVVTRDQMAVFLVRTFGL
jgi:beta-lactam-binding protein with PASTA domain